MCHILTKAFDLATKSMDGVKIGHVSEIKHRWESSLLHFACGYFTDETSIEVERMRLQSILKDAVEQYGSGLSVHLNISRIESLDGLSQIYYAIEMG